AAAGCGRLGRARRRRLSRAAAHFSLVPLNHPRPANPLMATARRDSVFSNHNFRLLFGGSTISMLGDQFTLVALPWLVLKLTGNPAALGLVLAAMALPRALFMLIGGAMVDRLSPRRVLLAARGANAWLVYLIALGIGLSTAFAYPAGSAILPQLVRKDQLQPANALVMGMRQLSMF